MQNLQPIEQIEKTIHVIRNEKVMLDSDLARLYEVETKTLIQAVKRNAERFPADFMFQLKHQDLSLLRSQIVTSSLDHGGRRYLPYVFTEQGVAMLSSVLRSRSAVKVNIEIMRAFVRMRKIIGSPNDSHKKIAELEQVQKIHGHLLNEHNDNIAIIFDAIRKLENYPEEASEPRQIGFCPEG